jgi:flavin-dependent amine oxidoreductase
VGNLHFCGEHCSVDFQGFMEGACETSARVAAALLQELKRPSTSLARLLGARQFPSSSFGPHAHRRLQQ